MKYMIYGALLGITTMAPGVSMAQNSQNPFENNEINGQRVESIHQMDWERHRPKPPLIDLKILQQSKIEVKQPPKVRPMDRKIQQNKPDKEVFGYLPYWGYKYLDTLNYDLLTTIAYFGLEINGQGEIVDAHDWPASTLINKAHQHGVRVVPTVILFNPTEISTLLASKDNQTTLINNLLNQVKTANADGVSIDFEGVRSDANQKEALVEFMTELSDRFHTELPDAYVTIFTPAMDWRKVYDYQALAEATDGLIMQGYDFHWSTAPTAGPVAPLEGTRWGNLNVTRTVNDYITKTNGAVDKLILSVPFYGFKWNTEDDQLESATQGRGTSLQYHLAYDYAFDYGRLWDSESHTPWFKWYDPDTAQWIQGWYDDAESIGEKLDLVQNDDLQGTAIWALTYSGDRTELQHTFKQHFGTALAPLKPESFSVHHQREGVKIAVAPIDDAAGYNFYVSDDGQHDFIHIYRPDPSMTFRGLPPNIPHYFKVTAVNAYGESQPTKTLATLSDLSLKSAQSGNPIPAKNPILIVDGATLRHDTPVAIRRLAEVLASQHLGFDAVNHTAVESKAVNLADYKAVIWLSGQENAHYEAFDSIEQKQVKAYLVQGGKLFVSGSEVGKALDGRQTDQNFFTNYLKAIYVQKQTAGIYTAKPTEDGLFKSMDTVTFDDGTQGSYKVSDPDGILPTSDAALCLSYDGEDSAQTGGACVQYTGTFGDGSQQAQLVYMTIPIETVYPEKNRQALVSNVLKYFGFGVQTTCPFLDVMCYFSQAMADSNQNQG
jgi:spore germination protein YaaH